MHHKPSELFREMVRIEVERQFVKSRRGRPSQLTFQDAYDSIMLLLRTGMQWRELRPQTSSFITVFKTMHKWIEKDIFKTSYRRLLKLYHRKRRPNYTVGSRNYKFVITINATA